MKYPQPDKELNEKNNMTRIFFIFCSEGTFFRVRTNLRH